MSVEAPSAPPSIGTSSVGSSIGSSMEGSSMGGSAEGLASPSLATFSTIDINGGSFRPGFSMSELTSMPELKVGSSSFINEGPSPAPAMALNDRLTTTIWSAESLKTPGASSVEPKTEMAPIARGLFHQPAEVTVPDLSIKPIAEEIAKEVDQTPSLPETPPITAESFPIMTISPEQDVVAASADAKPIFENAHAPQVQESPVVQTEPEIRTGPETQPALSPIGQIQTKEDRDLKLQAETITAQEVEADEKLALVTIDQIKTNPNLDPELQFQLIEQVQDIVAAKTQTEEVLEAQEATQEATVVQLEEEEEEEEVKRIEDKEPMVQTYSVEVEEIVDNENTVIDTRIKSHYTGTVRLRDLARKAQELFIEGASRVSKIGERYLPGEATTHLKDLQRAA